LFDFETLLEWKMRFLEAWKASKNRPHCLQLNFFPKVVLLFLLSFLCIFLIKPRAVIFLSSAGETLFESLISPSSHEFGKAWPQKNSHYEELYLYLDWVLRQELKEIVSVYFLVRVSFLLYEYRFRFARSFVSSFLLFFTAEE